MHGRLATLVGLLAFSAAAAAVDAVTCSPAKMSMAPKCQSHTGCALALAALDTCARAESFLEKLGALVAGRADVTNNDVFEARVPAFVQQHPFMVAANEAARRSALNTASDGRFERLEMKNSTGVRFYFEGTRGDTAPGFGVMVMSTGHMWRGQASRARQNGEGQALSPSGELRAGRFVEGNQQGPGGHQYGGYLDIGVYESGRQTGTFDHFLWDGRRQKITYDAQGKSVSRGPFVGPLLVVPGYTSSGEPTGQKLHLPPPVPELRPLEVLVAEWKTACSAERAAAIKHDKRGVKEAAYRIDQNFGDTYGYTGRRLPTEIEDQIRVAVLRGEQDPGGLWLCTSKFWLVQAGGDPASIRYLPVKLKQELQADFRQACPGDPMNDQWLLTGPDRIRAWRLRVQRENIYADKPDDRRRNDCETTFALKQFDGALKPLTPEAFRSSALVPEIAEICQREATDLNAVKGEERRSTNRLFSNFVHSTLFDGESQARETISRAAFMAFERIRRSEEPALNYLNACAASVRGSQLEMGAGDAGAKAERWKRLRAAFEASLASARP